MISWGKLTNTRTFDSVNNSKYYLTLGIFIGLIMPLGVVLASLFFPRVTKEFQVTSFVNLSFTLFCVKAISCHFQSWSRTLPMIIFSSVLTLMLTLPTMSQFLGKLIFLLSFIKMRKLKSQNLIDATLQFHEGFL